MGWVGLGWVEEMMRWVGLGYENWTHGHICLPPAVSLLFAAFVSGKLEIQIEIKF